MVKDARIDGHTVQAPSIDALAQKIRERAGFVIVPGLPKHVEKAKNENPIQMCRPDVLKDLFPPESEEGRPT